MSSAQPPVTPRTPISPNFTDYIQPMLTQSSSTMSTKIECRPRATSIKEVAAAPTPLNSQDALFERRRKHLLRPLAPLLNIETGESHPSFPRTVLQYHLLSNAELEELAHFYHQRTPTAHSTNYPMPIIARWHAMPDENDMNIDEQTQEIARQLGVKVDEIGPGKSKRRRFGRFLGLRGMESAVPCADGVMRQEMDRYVAREMAKREQKAREREVWEAKGF